MNIFEKAKSMASDIVDQAKDKAEQAANLAKENITMENAQAIKGRIGKLGDGLGISNFMDSVDPIADVAELHETKGHTAAVASLDDEKLLAYLNYRYDQLQEEVTEGKDAIVEKDAEEVVDSLIDIMVFTLGTLDLFGIDTKKAWKAVHEANMAKNAGIKPERPNPYGLPDLIKPEGWVAPTHEGNHGLIGKILKK